MLRCGVLVGFLDILLIAHLMVFTVDIHDIVEINFHIVCYKITSFLH